MNTHPNRPILELLAGQWLSMLGTAPVTGHSGNPYIGLLVFIAIPIGIYLGTMGATTASQLHPMS